MAFDKSTLIVEHNLNNLCSDKLKRYIPHVICSCGQVDFFFADRPFSLKAGESMIIIVPEWMEQVQPAANLQATCIYIKPEFLERCSPRSNYGIKGTLALLSCPIISMNEHQFTRLKHDFLQIEERLQNDKSPFQEDQLICATQMMFLDFFDTHASYDDLANISFQETDIISRFIGLLEQGDYITQREVSYYAEKLYITPKYLSEVCKSVSGKTANHWVNRFTVIHIRKLLQQKEKSFTEISDMFHFSSPAYFSRFVQKHLGASPTSFRE